MYIFSRSSVNLFVSNKVDLVLFCIKRNFKSCKYTLLLAIKNAFSSYSKLSLTISSSKLSEVKRLEQTLAEKLSPCFVMTGTPAQSASEASVSFKTNSFD